MFEKFSCIDKCFICVVISVNVDDEDDDNNSPAAVDAAVADDDNNDDNGEHSFVRTHCGQRLASLAEGRA